MNQPFGGEARDLAAAWSRIAQLEQLVGTLRTERDGVVLSYGQPGLDGAVPVGAIIMWSGAIADLPRGWALCDGNNGTPDLTDKFVVGAGDSYSPGDTGGASTAGPLTHSGTAVSAHSGTAVSAHAGAAVANHSDHTHPVNSLEDGVQSGSGISVITLVGANTGSASPALTHNVTQPSNHTVTQPSNHTVTQPSNHNAFSILPPYYALAFIMRTG